MRVWWTTVIVIKLFMYWSRFKVNDQKQESTDKIILSKIIFHLVMPWCSDVFMRQLILPEKGITLNRGIPVAKLLPRTISWNHKPPAYNRRQSLASEFRCCQFHIRPSAMSSSSLFRAATRARPLTTAYRASPIIRRPLLTFSSKTTRTFSTTVVRTAEASTGAATSSSDHHEESFEEFTARYAPNLALTMAEVEKEWNP